MTWLLTGGAGYIGAHIVRALARGGAARRRARRPLDRESGRTPVGRAARAGQHRRRRDAVRAALREHSVTGVVHLAAKKAVGESVEQPLLYWRENVGRDPQPARGLPTPRASTACVFSSSAAVYGEPEIDEVDEDAPTRPISPYGETKLVCEWMIARRRRRHRPALGRAALLQRRRRGRPRARRPRRLQPRAARLQALSSGAHPKVFGDDYTRRDGSCIRDYIHVVDLAEAHVAAAQALTQGPLGGVFNIGRGEGSTVRRCSTMVARGHGHRLRVRRGRPPRPGDPSDVVARPRQGPTRARLDREAATCATWSRAPGRRGRPVKPQSSGAGTRPASRSATARMLRSSWSRSSVSPDGPVSWVRLSWSATRTSSS